MRIVSRSVARRIATVTIFAAASTAGAVEEPSLEVRVLSRSLAPGEAVHVLVDSRVALASVGGRFLDRPLFFVRRPDSDRLERGGERWLAWSLVDLDRRAGPGTVEVVGRTAEGQEVHGARSVRVLRKRFPTDRVEVESRYVTPPAEVA